MKNEPICPDCAGGLDRREFLSSVAATAAAAGVGGLWLPSAQAAPRPDSPAEKAVKALYDTLKDDQKKLICFDWDFKDSRGLLRNHVSNNWHITRPTIDSDFFTSDQKELCRQVFKNIFNPDWIERIDKQLKDDTGGKPWGAEQNIAIFGNPSSGPFKFVMTGRHLTIRCDGNSEASVPWGGPIFHGHAASGFNEKPGHPGNIFWHQALTANKVYQILSEKQKDQALVARRPAESAVGFRGPDGKYPGLAIADMSRDQKEGVKATLKSLLEPYRQEDRDEIIQCMEKYGGLDRCSLAFYRDGDLGDDGEWDNWRLEGPAFVWYFRGHPHVHIWVNIAEDHSLPLNARG